jgi:glycosyltransferase involved in cell wall biosynthesis
LRADTHHVPGVAEDGHEPDSVSVKIAILAIGGFDRSGTGNVIPCLLWLIEQLAASRHEVHVFVPVQENKPGTWPLLGATIHNAGQGLWRLRMLTAIGREHQRSHFDVIHAFWTGMGVVGAMAGTLLRLPMVLTLPGGDTVSLPKIGYGARRSLRGRVEFRIATRAAVLTTVPSGFMQDQAATLGVESLIVPLGADAARSLPARPRLRDLSRPLKLIHVASLNRVKDQPTLLQALRILKAEGFRFEMRIIGFDTLAGEIQRLACELGLDQEVQFLGVVDNEDLREHYDWADLLVMASRHEAGPVVMLEAALAGVPTVGTRVGHLADQSPDAAVAVPIGDAAALAEAIRTIGGDEAGRVSLAQAAQAFSISHDASFTAQTFTEMYLRISGRRETAVVRSEELRS